MTKEINVSGSDVVTVKRMRHEDEIKFVELSCSDNYQGRYASVWLNSEHLDTLIEELVALRKEFV